MILTCPECATSYFVDDLRVPRGGRMVKCTNCGARWRAFQDRSGPEGEAPEDDLLIEAPPTETPPPEEEVVAEPAPRPRSRPSPKPAAKRSPVMMVGLGVLATLAVVGGAAVILRQQIADLVPATAPVYAAIGLPVNTIGLVIEDVTSKSGFQGGKPVLAITGSIRSVRKQSAEAPPMRVSLLNKDGQPVVSIVAQPLNAKVPPGAVRYFALSMPDPPSGATELEVAFDPTAKVEVPPTPTPAAAAPGATVPAAQPVAAPVEAQPLPPGSPDALEPHD